MHIRAAVEQDHATLSDLMRRSIASGYRETYGAEIVDAWTHKDNTVFNFTIPARTMVGEIDGRPVGFCSWAPQADDAATPKPGDDRVIPAMGYARINRLFLLPDLFGSGLGRKLLKATEDTARDAGFRRFVLWSSINAVPFYMTAGYDEIAENRIPITKNQKIPVVKMIKRF